MKIKSNDHDALNAAFAEKVAGWIVNFCEGRKYMSPDGENWHLWSIPDFTRSADAVLPWLEKKEIFDAIWNNNPYTGESGCSVMVADAFTEDLKEPAGRSPWCYAQTFPHAAVIALLRANGVKIEDES